jgi:hypothetical protein
MTRSFAAISRRFAASSVLGLTGTLLVTTSLAGCADENDPKTWVKRLDEPKDRVAAIKRLQGFYDDAYGNAGRDAGAASVTALLDVIVQPMTNTYVSADLDEKTRKELMHSLAGMHDARTAPALAKALGSCESNKGNEEARDAAQAAKDMAMAGQAVDPTVADGLWTCFTKMQASKPATASTLTAVHDAIRAVKSPSYGPKAVTLLAVPVDVKNADSAADQLRAWQLTAVQVIGDLKYAPGARSLVTVLLTPEKRPLWPAAEAGLVAIPKESETLLIGALNGSDPAFAAAAKTFGPEKTQIAIAADALGQISRPAGRDALYAIVPSLDNDDNRRAIATTLVKFPRDGKSWGMFAGLYDKLPDDPEKMQAKGSLAQAASQFYDPAVTDWAVKEANGAKGDSASILQIPALDTAIKLMTAAQEGEVKSALDPVVAFLTKNGSQDEQAGAKTEKAMYDAAVPLLARCTTDPLCYAKTLDTPIGSDPTASAGPVKAIYMSVETAGSNAPAVEKALLAHVSAVKQPAVRIALVEAIDKLAPNGDAAAADQLDKIIVADKAAGDPKVLASDDTVAKVAARLRARL